jgi:serine phosphatase RsbU (regulator of sigma subunit)
MNANTMKNLIVIILLFLSNLYNSQSLTTGQIDSVLEKHSSGSALNTDFNSYFAKNKEVYDQAIKIGYKKGVAISANNLAIVYNYQQDYFTTLKYLNEAHKIGIQIQDTDIIATALVGIANVYWSTNDIKKATVYFNNSLVLAIKSKNYENAYYTEYGLGLVDFVNDSINSSLKRFHKSLQYCFKDKNINPENKITTYIQLGVLHYYKFKNIDSATYYYEKANKLAVANNDNINIGISSMLLSDIANSKKDYKSAKEILGIAAEKIKKFNDYNRLNQIYSRIALIDAKTKNFKSAFENLLEAYNLKDSVLSQDKTKEITTLKLNSEFEKEKEVLSLKKQQEQDILNEKIHSEHIINYFLVAVALLLSIVAIVIFKSYRAKHKTNLIIEHQHKEMTDSINYAKGIQEAIMPAIKDDNVFVFYQPKDIVSGDFYWSFEKDDFKYYAVADCTGHGVPGALMSMLCSQLLNEAVELHGYNAHYVIGHVQSMLDKKMKAMGRNDGMEIGLVCIWRGNVYFTGIKRPLYIVRNGEIQTIKPVDGEMTRVGIQSGDNVYMTTDGYSDQFGTCNKKFTSKLMKHEMVINSKYSTIEQLEKFKHTINYWKGDTEQTDDILLMGFKF